jgi:hypothetical protein
MTSRFITGMQRANVLSHRIMSEPATLNGNTIMVAVDDLSQTSFARSGGRSDGTEAAVFVNEAEFRAAGGKKGSIITLSNGKASQVQRTADFQGVLYLTLAPFRP